MTNQSLYRYIDGFAPFATALGFDNCGLLLGSPETDHKKCLLALDVTPAVLEEALQKQVRLIVTHHPVIFHPLKQLSPADLPYKLIQNNIDVLSAHTNFDMAPDGVNDCLIHLLGLEKLSPLPGSEGCAALCRCKSPVSGPADLADSVKSALGLPALRLMAGSRPLNTIAVCCGSGGSFLDAALAAGADAFITGDLKHSHAVQAAAAGVTLIDAGHFETETIALLPLCRRLAQAFPDCSFAVAEANRPLFRLV